MARWYDQYGKFSHYIEQMKDMNPSVRERMVSDILVIIRDNAPGLLDATVDEYPLEAQRMRWYDTDPYLWLMINGLERADAVLIGHVVDYFEGL